MIKQQPISTKQMHKRSQAAIEFLVTYGWAILAVMIVIAALVYFGVFNTSKYVDHYCNFGDQWSCEDYILIANGNLHFRVRNNFGVTINVLDPITATTDIGTMTCKAVDIDQLGVNNEPEENNIPPSMLIDILCTTTPNPLSVGQTAKIKVEITFQRTGSSTTHKQTGDIFTVVQ